MKKKRFVCVVNWILLFSIPVMLLTVDVKTETINSSISVKNMPTNLFIKVLEQEEKVEDLEITKKDIEVDDQEKNITENIEQKKEVEVPKVIESPKEEVIQDQDVIEEKQVVETNTNIEVKEEVKTDVIESFSGNLSYYRANCNGCSGFTATGYDVRDGRIYYNDSQYGNVRIIASGTEIPKHSIVRIKNSSLGNEVLAIVLDRGGNIGQGKKFIVDVLTNSVEAKGGVDRNIVVEVVRRGK